MMYTYLATWSVHSLDSITKAESSFIASADKEHKLQLTLCQRKYDIIKGPLKSMTPRKVFISDDRKTIVFSTNTDSLYVI